jgi:hypothetical protein
MDQAFHIYLYIAGLGLTGVTLSPQKTHLTPTNNDHLGRKRITIKLNQVCLLGVGGKV